MWNSGACHASTHGADRDGTADMVHTWMPSDATWRPRLTSVATVLGTMWSLARDLVRTFAEEGRDEVTSDKEEGGSEIRLTVATGFRWSSSEGEVHMV